MADTPADPPSLVRTAVEDAWKSLQDTKGWTSDLTMPFPKVWNGKPTALIWYAYASRMIPTLADGVEVSHPWAWLELPLGKDAQVDTQVLSSKMDVLGIQGVRPLSAAELKLLQGQPPLWKLLQEGQATDEVKQRVKQWMSVNGTIFAAVASHHQTFVNWVNS